MSRRPELKPRDDRREPPLPARAFMAASTLVTLSLLGYVLVQALQSSADTVPEARVIATAVDDDGSVLVTVEVQSPGGVGLIEATVEVDCKTPAPSLTLQEIPAGGRRVGTLVCPPGTVDPRASVASWMPA